MSLLTPHPLWTTCGSNSFEVSKAIIQAKLLSVRYRTDSLLQHFGVLDTLKCSLCHEDCDGSLEHLLVQCQSLSHYYETQMNMIQNLSPISRKTVENAKSESVVSFIQLALVGSFYITNQNDKSNKMICLNPGACGYKGFHKVRTILRFDVDLGSLKNLEVIELGNRSKLIKD